MYLYQYRVKHPRLLFGLFWLINFLPRGRLRSLCAKPVRWFGSRFCIKKITVPFIIW
jgi:hypothetical protein